jgi:hypothetical protein
VTQTGPEKLATKREKRKLRYPASSSPPARIDLPLLIEEYQLPTDFSDEGNKKAPGVAARRLKK